MKNKHLTLQDRLSIEQMLNERNTFTEIARALGKDKCTISKEIRAHTKSLKVGGKGYNYNSCKNRYGCQKSRICKVCNSPQKFKLCHRCALCNLHCPDFVKETCTKHEKPPYMCNSCGNRPFCTLEKKVYIANHAHEDYQTLLPHFLTQLICQCRNSEILF